MSYNFTHPSHAVPVNRCMGRQGFLGSIVALVTDPEPVVVNLVGPRWIGKTSVLKCLAPDITPALNELAYVYIDLSQDTEGVEPLALIADELTQALQARYSLRNAGGSRPEKSPEKRLRALCDLAQAHHVRPLICIDHLDKYLTKARNPIDWGSSLTMLAEFASLVLATERTLTDISPELSASPFVHRTIVLTLGLLDEKDADELLAAFTIGPGTELSAGDRENLIRMVGRHPYILRRAARQANVLLQESPERQQKGISINDIRARIEPVLRPLFEALWREYGDLLRRYHASLTPQGQPGADGATRRDLEYEKAAARAVRQELQRAALIYEKRDRQNEFAYFSTLFESFVFQKVTSIAPPAEAHNGKPMPLTDMLAVLDIREGTRESQLLGLLVDNAGSVIKDPQLEAAIWGREVPDRAIVTTVGRLRGKLQQHESKINGRIVRVRGTGYTFQWQPPAM